MTSVLLATSALAVWPLMAVAYRIAYRLIGQEAVDGAVERSLVLTTLEAVLFASPPGLAYAAFLTAVY